MEKTQDELVNAVARCNEKIVEFIDELNKDTACEIFNMTNVPLKDCLSFLEGEEKKKIHNPNLDMANFWYNARSTYMKRLVQLTDSEVA